MGSPIDLTRFQETIPLTGEPVCAIRLESGTRVVSCSGLFGRYPTHGDETG